MSVRTRLQDYLRFLVLLLLKAVARSFYRADASSIDGGPIPGAPWDQIRLICFLNHTSLFEPLFAAVVPNRFIWQIATRAVVPVADITLNRPIAGPFLRMLIPNPVAISREPDHTWEAVLEKIDDRALVIIMPEGRMRRATGLDRHSKPMRSRGGVAQILDRLDSGQLLMAYSGGLHHIQVPGQRFPHLFRTLRIRFELLSIPDYRREMKRLAAGRSLKATIKADLDHRRDLYCPMTEESTRQPIGSRPSNSHPHPHRAE